MQTAHGENGSSASTTHLSQEVETVSAIRLQGAPRVLLLDEGAILSPDGDTSPSLLAKLHVLSQSQGMRIVVLSVHTEPVREALTGIAHLEIVRSTDGLSLDAPTMAILARAVTLPTHVFAWYVGTESPSPGFHTSRHTGWKATDQILALFGTALVQERAGIAFRAAGAGKEMPRQSPFDPGILGGIAGAVSRHPRQVERLEQHTPADLDGDVESTIAAAFAPIESCQAKDGALAAAPPPSGPDQPNYWFFWQRDAGQVILALADLMRHAKDKTIRSRASTVVDRYLDFVERLPKQPGTGAGSLGVSRFEMDGRPIRSYGNPQKDGPAQTALAVVAALGESEREHAIIAPYLTYLSEHMSGPSFDPWEFAAGSIFFDYNLARRALRAGARVARAVGETKAADGYDHVADEIERTLDRYIHPGEGYIRSGRDFLQPFLGTISNLDIGVVGSVLTAYDVADPVLNVEHPLVMGTMHALEHVYAGRWPVNVAWQAEGSSGMGMGRFPEDANDGVGSTGGNPWTFATLWSAQYYVRLIERRRYLNLPDRRQEAELLEKADGYLRFILAHGTPDALTEQIDGQTGKPRGARQLAWSQAALIQTLLLRRRLVEYAPIP